MWQLLPPRTFATDLEPPLRLGDLWAAPDVPEEAAPAGRRAHGDETVLSAAILGECIRNVISQLAPRRLEAGDPVRLQCAEDVAHVDADGPQGVHHLLRRAIGAANGLAADHAVVGDRPQSGLRHRVHRARGYEVDDGAGVVVSGVLDPG